LRGTGPSSPRPPQRPRPPQNAEPTTAIPTPPRQRGNQARPPVKPDAEPTTAIPTPRQADPEATEKLTAQEAEQQVRRRGAVSAAELLRREGRGR
jgi:RND superfamily putative drug exporter